MQPTQNADLKRMTHEVRETLNEITKASVPCATNSSRTKRFKITISTSQLRFSHVIAVDLTYIERRPVLHIVDEATHFRSTCFLKKVSSEKVWNSILKYWSGIYLGLPEAIHVDQGSQFI